jgi:hypothetical protein
MIKTRITGTAALFTFGFAALGGIALAAPGNAEPGTSGTGSSSGSSSTSGPAGGAVKSDHMIPGLKSQQPTQDHLIPGPKLQPFTTGSGDGPTVKLGSTDDSDSSPALRIDQAWGVCTLGC